jgi:hypothetical protein
MKSVRGIAAQADDVLLLGKLAKTDTAFIICVNLFLTLRGFRFNNSLPVIQCDHTVDVSFLMLCRKFF